MGRDERKCVASAKPVRHVPVPDMSTISARNVLRWIPIIGARPPVLSRRIITPASVPAYLFDLKYFIFEHLWCNHRRRKRNGLAEDAGARKCLGEINYEDGNFSVQKRSSVVVPDAVQISIHRAGPEKRLSGNVLEAKRAGHIGREYAGVQERNRFARPERLCRPRHEAIAAHKRAAAQDKPKHHPAVPATANLNKRRRRNLHHHRISFQMHCLCRLN